MNRARFSLLAAAAMTAGVMFAQQAPVSDTVMNPSANNPAAIAEGQRIYDGACQSCHGAAAAGDPGRGGPALNTTGLKHGDGDADLFRSIRQGVPGTQMPPYKGFRDEQVWQLVSYLRSLQSNAPAAGSSVGARKPEGDVAAGEALFFGKAGCASCHEVNARGGVTGPDLSSAGRLAADIIRQKIVSPNQPLPPPPGARGGGGRGAPPPVTVVARMQDGREIRGVRRNEDQFSVQMVDASGQLHLLDKLRLASVTVETRSLMPNDYATRLTPAEIASIVAYLRMQEGRDLTKTVMQPIAGGVTFERLVKAKAEPHNWLMYWGDYQGTHYSPLTQITPGNVGRLEAAWSFPILGGNSVLEATPLVVDGVMYTTGSGNPATVTAIDARTGRQIWRWTRQQKTVNPYEINPFSRGAAILGNRIFVGTLDGFLIALDARTGQPLWEVEVVDTMEGSSITSPPVVLKDMVITGMTGGEYATRGFLDAYDAATGKRRWRFYTIPAPGEFGNDTWKGDSWKTGGGPTWLTGSYDPELNLIYWAVGNPAPEFDRSARGEMDNLYTNSVVALDADTGKLEWYYQFTPDDGHDWDSVQDMVLVDRTWRGQQRKLLMHADRNGHFYVLDRTNGTFLSGTPFVYQNWNAGFTEKGRPQPVPGSNSSPTGSFLVYPTLGGATNFQAPSYSPLTGWLYLVFAEGGQQYFSSPQQITRGQQYLGRGRASGPPPARGPNQPAPNTGIKALDPETGKTVWSYPLFQGSLTNGVLATGGNVLFVSARDGNIIGLDAKTGKYLWHYQTGGNHAASPISYAVSDKQYVALAAGNVVFSFTLQE
jgi:alcohol dehydrogenase (cytochrome c)